MKFFFPVDDKHISAPSRKHLKMHYSLIPVKYVLLLCRKFLFVLSVGLQDRLEDCRSFLSRHSLLLSSWPALFLQQALNEPPKTSAHIWAQGLGVKGDVRILKWLNKDHQLQQETRWAGGLLLSAVIFVLCFQM